jgi:hypothetical protein
MLMVFLQLYYIRVGFPAGSRFFSGIESFLLFCGCLLGMVLLASASFSYSLCLFFLVTFFNFYVFYSWLMAFLPCVQLGGVPFERLFVFNATFPADECPVSSVPRFTEFCSSLVGLLLTHSSLTLVLLLPFCFSCSSCRASILLLLSHIYLYPFPWVFSFLFRYFFQSDNCPLFLVVPLLLPFTFISFILRPIYPRSPPPPHMLHTSVGTMESLTTDKKNSRSFGSCCA